MAEETEMVARQQRNHPVDQLRAVTEPAQVIEVQDAVRGVRVDPSLMTYAVEIVAATRDRTEVLIGGSPRASLGLVRLAQARSLLFGRAYVLPDDIKELAGFVLPHRLVMRRGGEAARGLVQEILASAPVPVTSR